MDPTNYQHCNGSLHRNARPQIETRNCSLHLPRVKCINVCKRGHHIYRRGIALSRPEETLYPRNKSEKDVFPFGSGDALNADWQGIGFQPHFQSRPYYADV